MVFRAGDAPSLSTIGAQEARPFSSRHLTQEDISKPPLEAGRVRSYASDLEGAPSISKFQAMSPLAQSNVLLHQQGDDCQKLYTSLSPEQRKALSNDAKAHVLEEQGKSAQPIPDQEAFKRMSVVQQSKVLLALDGKTCQDYYKLLTPTQQKALSSDAKSHILEQQDASPSMASTSPSTAPATRPLAHTSAPELPNNASASDVVLYSQNQIAREKAGPTLGRADLEKTFDTEKEKLKNAQAKEESEFLKTAEVKKGPLGIGSVHVGLDGLHERQRADRESQSSAQRTRREEMNGRRGKEPSHVGEAGKGSDPGYIVQKDDYPVNETLNKVGSAVKDNGNKILHNLNPFR